jgi:hypothetical protein
MGFQDTKFEVIEVKSNGTKNYYLEGFVSTTDPDLVNDIVTEKAQEEILAQLNGRNVTVDDDHDSYRDNQTGKPYDRTMHKLPLGLIERAELRQKDNAIGTWVRVKLNQDYPKFKEYLNSIKNGFVHSFSIAYKPIKAFTKVVNGVKQRIIDNLNIMNVCATGNPVNTEANFSLALKSFPKMVEEVKNEETVSNEETTVVEQKSETKACDSQPEQKGMDYKKMYEELKAKYDKMMSEKESSKKDDKKDTEMKSLAENNSKIEALEKEVAELKSKLEAPQLKSLVEKKSVEPQSQEVGKVSMWDVM